MELDEITPWNDAALVAGCLYDRRVFLAGDATHVLSPMGGFALNVGVEDAHNLAWRLAAVLKGWAPHALLDSYQVEHSALNSGSIRTTNNGSANASPAQPPWRRPELAREHGLVFGMIYDSPVIGPDGTAPIQVAVPIMDYAPNARPGSRAPHVWLERDGERISTPDLFDREFVVFAGAKGKSWCDAGKEISRSQSVPIQTFRVGMGGDFADASHAWATTYGVEEDGAMLVRPDPYVV